LISCGNNKIENDLAKRNLQGNVFSISQRLYNAKNKFGEITAVGSSKWSFLFNEDIFFNEKGFIYRENNFDDEQLFKSMTYYDYSKEDTLRSKRYYRNNLKEFTKYKYDYDKFGNIKISSFYDVEGNLSSKSIYKYDEFNNKIQYSYFNADGELDYKYLYTYDSKGNKLSDTKYDEKGDFEFEYIYTYDGNGNELSRTKNKANNDLENQYVYSYDKFNNKIKSLKYDKYKTVLDSTIYSYKYDKFNNWIEKIEIDKFGNPVEIQKREITYYEDEVGKLDLFIKNESLKDSSRYYVARINDYSIEEMQGDNYKLANNLLNKALRFDDKNPKIYYYKAIILERNKKFDDAIIEYNMAFNLNEFYYSALNAKANILYSKEKINEAFKLYSKVIEMSYEKAIYYYNRGRAFVELDDYSSAIDDFSKAIEINPKYESTYWWRGYTFYKLENYSSAIDDFSKSIEFDSGDDLASTYYFRGLCKGYLKMDMCDDMKKACELKENNACKLKREFCR
tara:strand:- start:1145 stop:2668 length:1524 start_codon:yes stop_codon:yes gene_type:complete